MAPRNNFERTYRLELGAKQTLSAVLPSLPQMVNRWQEMADSGVIDHQFREIAVALGWITSRDSRIVEIKDGPPQRQRPHASVAKEPPGTK